MAMTQSVPVVKVIGSGLASLETIPYIVEEMLRGGVPILRPRAFDHDRETIQRFRDRIEGLQDLFRANGCEFGPDDCVEPVFGQLATREGIKRRNPPFYEIEKLDDMGPVEMYDRPCALAEWAEQHATRIWDDIRDEWMEYRKDHPENNRLVLIIPYCPEGPTSGTIGIMLGSKLLNRVREVRRRGDLDNLQVRIYGIELCPPMPYSSTKSDPNLLANSFRGYVAREELLGNQIDPRPFDAIFAVDVGRELNISRNNRELLEGLDRAAARVALAVVKGVLGKDQGESDSQIATSWRWQVVPLQIRTDPFELQVLPILAAFPEVADGAAETVDLLSKYSQASDQLNAAYGEKWIQEGFGRCDIDEAEIRQVKSAGDTWRQTLRECIQIKNRHRKWWLPIRRPSRQRVLDSQQEVRVAARVAQDSKARIEQRVGTEDLKWKPQVLGYEVELSRDEVQAYLRQRQPLAKLMTVLKMKDLANGLSERVSGYLLRYIWEPENHPGVTKIGGFAKVLVTTVGHEENSEFSPAVGVLAIHTRASDESYVYFQEPNPSLIDIRSDIESDLGCDIFIFAADATLQDVASYQDLAQVYYEIRSDKQRWYDSARFYMLEIPSELLDYHEERKNGFQDPEDTLPDSDDN